MLAVHEITENHKTFYTEACSQARTWTEIHVAGFGLSIDDFCLQVLSCATVLLLGDKSTH